MNYTRMSRLELAEHVDSYFRDELHAPDIFEAAKAHEELCRRLKRAPGFENDQQHCYYHWHADGKVWVEQDGGSHIHEPATPGGRWMLRISDGEEISYHSSLGEVVAHIKSIWPGMVVCFD